MADLVEQQPVDEAAELEVVAAQAIEACGGDMLATVKALIVANSLLEAELSEVYAKAPRAPGAEAQGFEQNVKVARRPQ